MKKSLLLLAFAALFCSCHRNSVRRPKLSRAEKRAKAEAEYEANAPANEADRIHSISYPLYSRGFRHSPDRMDAYKSMHDNCGGKYIVVQEYDTSDGVSLPNPPEQGGYGIGAGIANALSSNDVVNLQRHHIDYKCLPAN